LAWKVPLSPVKPCIMTRLVSSIRMLIAVKLPFKPLAAKVFDHAVLAIMNQVAHRPEFGASTGRACR
jgi:hypothetical protein